MTVSVCSSPVLTVEDPLHLDIGVGDEGLDFGADFHSDALSAQSRHIHGARHIHVNAGRLLKAGTGCHIFGIGLLLVQQRLCRRLAHGAVGNQLGQQGVLLPVDLCKQRLVGHCHHIVSEKFALRHGGVVYTLLCGKGDSLVIGKLAALTVAVAKGAQHKGAVHLRIAQAVGAKLRLGNPVGQLVGVKPRNMGLRPLGNIP